MTINVKRVEKMNFGLIVPKYLLKGQTYNFNYGLALTSACMKKAGINVFCLDLNHGESVRDQIKEFIGKNNIEVVYTEETFVWHKEIREIFETVKSLDSKIITIAGGTIVNCISVPFWGINSIDYGVHGDVEETIIELSNALINKKDIVSIKGISYYTKNHEYIVNPARSLIKDLDALPIPDYEGFNYARYMKFFFPSENHFYSVLDNVRPGTIMTSRSCPYRCTFCYVHLDIPYRQRSLDNVFNEIDYLVKTYDINFLNTENLLFSINKERLIEFAKRIKKYNIKWWAQMRVSYVDDELLKILKDSGMFMTSYGIENINKKILHSMKKHITKEEIENALKLSHENKLNIQGNIILGDVEETIESANESIEWLKNHNEYGLNLVMIRTHPGSPLYKFALSSGKLKDELEHLNNVFPLINLSKMNDEEYQKVNIYTENYPFDSKSFFNGKILKSVMTGDSVYTLIIKCPHCNTITEYKNMHHSSFKTYFKVICRDCHVHLRIENIKAYSQEYTLYEKLIIIIIREIKSHSNNNFVIRNIYRAVKSLKHKKIIKVSDKYV